MKTFKKIAVGVAIIIAIPLVVALFVRKDYVIEREITINKPKEEVFNYMRHLKNQDNYSKWVRLDPAMKKAYRGTDGTVGFVYAWDGNNEAGKGEQEITNIENGERIDVEIRFEKPFQGIAFAPIVTESVSSNKTRVKWGMRGKSFYPLNFMNLFMDDMLGKDIETSLYTLKGVLEKS